MKIRRIFFGALLCFSTQLRAEDLHRFDYLEAFQARIPNPPPEARRTFADDDTPVDLDLTDFYRATTQGGVVNIFWGIGVQFYGPEVSRTFFDGFREAARRENVRLTNWQINDDGTRFSFYSPNSRKTYRVTVGHRRDEFAASFAKYPVVIYTGHSREGRGPAFESFTYYYRLGNTYPLIEVDVRNPFFLDEALQNTAQYPASRVELNGSPFEFQYRGQKDDTSYLEADAYTKLIEGGPKDFRATNFLPTKQIFFIWSCQNSHYYKKPIRDRFRAQDKIVIGTKEVPTKGLIEPLTIFMLDLVRQTPRTVGIIDDLNAADNSYTSY